MLRFFLLIIVSSAFVSSAAAAPPKKLSVEQAELLFVRQIQPLFVAKCGGCHGKDAKELKGGFDMRDRRGLLTGGESEEPAIVPGKPDSSPLFKAILWEDGLEMPPKENDRLTKQQMELVRVWIAHQAPWPNATRQKELLKKVVATSADGVIVKTSGGQSPSWTNRLYRPEDLWAYQPIRDPKVPWEYLGKLTVNNRNPIDAFIERKLSAAGLPSTKLADRRTFIRRATFDLTGLPPTPQQIKAFLAGTWDEAIDSLLNRLLSSPRYGEQWGKHWLDVVRYADSSGFANDYARPNAWRYRDYVIRSFNNDKPYDQFIREQIAGDEIDAKNTENLIAVGFLRMGPWEHTSMSVDAVTRQHFLDDVTNSVGVTFLGHELRCAKCHDHKFDPIPTLDYYRIQAVFAPVQFADRGAAYLPHENSKSLQDVEARMQRLIAKGGVRSIKTLPAEARPVNEYDLDTESKGHAKVNRKRSGILKRGLKAAKPLAFSVYSGQQRRFQSRTVVNKPGRIGGVAPATHVLKGGSIETPGAQVAPGILSTASFTTKSDLTSNTIGRRREFARWVASPKNPLTARVMVNRIWQYHFGRGLAGNPNNFGKTGQKPTHPELLDLLASYFIKNDWSIKKLHRLIMTSNTFRRSGGPVPDKAAEVDPDNKLLSHFKPRRLAAEELRDSMLAISGELNLEMGGFPNHPAINMEIAMQPRHVMGSVAMAYQPSRTPQERHRRTVYAERIRTLRDPMLEVFNQPNLDVSCEARDVATTTPQVFTLFNGQNSYDRAIAMAVRIEKTKKTVANQIELMFQLAFGRDATPDEIEVCSAHIAKMTKHHEKNPSVKVEPPKYVVRQMVEELTGLNFYWVEDLDIYQDYVPDQNSWDVELATRALADVCLVVFNSNEFMYVY